MEKLISSCKQQNADTVYLYDSTGNYMCCVPGTLIGFTSTTVTVKTRSGSTYVYNNKGNYMHSI